MVKQLIFINQAISPISVDIINAFMRQGISVTLYTGSPKFAQMGLNSGVCVKQQAAYRPSSALYRLWTWSTFFIWTLFTLAITKKRYEIFAVTNPPFNMFTVIILNKLFGVKYHILLFDIYPDAAVQYQYFRTGSLFDRVWSYLNRVCFSNAENLFTISERMRDTLRKYTASEQEIHVIHNWADNLEIYPLDKSKNPFLIQYGLADKKTVLYSGNFGKTHDISSIVEAAKLLAHRNDIHFLLIGGGDQKEGIAQLVDEYALQNLCLLPYVDLETFRFSVASGDITIVTLDSRAASVSTPSKIYYAMAAGSAIVAVASADSELADLVLKYEMGVVVPPGNAPQLAETLESLLDDATRLSRFSENARQASHEYTPANAEIYSKVVAGLPLDSSDSEIL